MAPDTDPIGQLLAPADRTVFFHEHWETKPLVVSRGQPHFYDRLLTLGELDRVVTTFQLSHPDIMVVDARREVGVAQYTFPGGAIDVVRLYGLHASGATLIVNQLDRFLAPLAKLCRDLERQVSARLQANVYLTPTDAQGFKPHYDNHDVLVLQVQGSKHWRLYGTPVALPFRGEEFRPGQVQVGDPEMEFDLHAGDFLYLPRGIMHDAVALGGCGSLHITLGIMSTSWTEFLIEAVGRVGIDDPEFRRGLPIGYARPDFDRTSLRGTFERLLQRAVERADINSALDHFIEGLSSTRQTLLQGQLMQIQRLNGLTLESEVGVRPDLSCRLHETDAALVVTSADGAVSFPLHTAATVRYALERGAFAVGALPGDLDDASKLVLVRRLVREGFLQQL